MASVLKSAFAGFVLLGVLVSMSGCASVAHKEERSVLEAEYRAIEQELDDTGQLIGRNGYLIVPEIWGYLAPSAMAWLAHAAVSGQGLDNLDSTKVREMYSEMLEEGYAPVESAFILARTGLLKYVTASDLSLDVGMLWHKALTNDSGTEVFYLAWIGRAWSLNLDAYADEFDEWVEKVEEGGSFADCAYLAGTRAALDDDVPVLSVKQGAYKDSANASALFLALADSRVEADAVPVGLVADSIRSSADSDFRWWQTWQAFTLLDEDQSALRVSKLFDTRRMLGEGNILEAPLFAGTVNSSFRTLRYDSLSGHSLLSTKVRKRFATGIGNEKMPDSPTESLAFHAVKKQIGLENLTARDAQVLIESVFDEVELGDIQGLYDYDDSIVWAQIAEYALEIGEVPVFPGLSEKGVQEWQDFGWDSIEMSPARLLILLHDSGQLGQNQLTEDTLCDQVEFLKSEYALKDLRTSVAIASQLAFLYLRNEDLWPSAEIEELIANRAGGCLGGYEGLYREGDELSECDIEAARFIAIWQAERRAH